MKITVDEQTCVGCRLCEQACVFGRRRHFDPDASSIQVLVDANGDLQIEISSDCERCAAALCARFCPVGAIAVHAG